MINSETLSSISALPIREVSFVEDIARTLDEKLWRLYLKWTLSPLIDSDLRRREWNFLESIVSKSHVRSYLEVGVYHLGCVRRIAQILQTRNDPIMVGVDLFDSLNVDATVTILNQTHVGDILSLQEAKERVKDLPFVRLVAGDSSKVLVRLKDERFLFDVIFIDGNHAYEAAASDAENALKLLSNNGYLFLHNTSNDFNPDKDYIRTDGGPNRVVVQLKNHRDLKWVQQCERMSLFQYVPYENIR